MNLELLHRRLVVVMALSGLLAFAAGAGFEPASAILAGFVLIVALFWQPSAEMSATLEKLWVPLALVLVVRAVLQVTVLGGDVVVPVVDLLLLLLCAEALRTPDAPNDVRLYALTFALILASTAYRPGVLFALSFILFVVLGSIALAVGLLRRKSLRFGTAEASLDRSFVMTSVLLSGITIGMAIAVFVTFPRVSRGWAGRGEVLASSIAGFSDQISLGQHGSSIAANPEIVLRVEFPEGRPEEISSLHWRGRSYDNFDGVRWSRSSGVRPSAAPTRWYRERWPDETLVQKVYAAPLDVSVIFGVHPIVAVAPESDIQPMYDNVGDFFFWGSDQQPTYTSFSMARPPPADSLRAATGNYFPDRRHYLQLPTLPDRIQMLADSLTEPWESRYDKIVAVQRWLTSEFDYTRQLPRNAGETSLDYFLFERQAGHCEYFSSAMVVLLRSVGIHARNINGFLGGRWNEFGGYVAVTQNEAHSWVEVWFPEWGWVQFDPTPAGGGEGTAEANWWWPGQLWFDGVQHRWNRWVLDYTMENQISLFERLGDLLGNREPGGDAGSDGSIPGWVWWLVAGVPVVGFLLRYRAGWPRRLPPETRAYQKLLRAAGRAGVLPDAGEVTPAMLLHAIDRDRPAATPSARDLVDTYQALRFGGRKRTSETESRLREALSAARRALGSHRLLP